MFHTDHDELQRLYIEALRGALRAVREIRDGQVENLTERFGGNEASAREAVEESPPCHDPPVIGVIRRFWLECDRINAAHPRTTIEPLEFVFRSLREAAPDLYAALSQIQYWPVGRDDEGRWL